MDFISLPAHFGGEHIRLDKPFELPRNAQLIVTILAPVGSEDDSWAGIAATGLSRAYGDDEPEYTVADLK